MITDSRDLPSGHTIRKPVCVFGSGPAGLSLALRLSAQGLDVVIVEAGGREVEQESQDFYRGAVVGDPYFDLDEARLRMLGGTSMHWTGVCRTLDPIDFKHERCFEHAGWPIGHDDLSPYLPDASEILNISGDFLDEAVSPEVVFREHKLTDPEPLRFADKYESEIQSSSRIDLVLHAALVNLVHDEGIVRRAEVRTSNGKTLWVEADFFALCLGGIENSRALLWINERNDRKLVANHDMIGRFWMEHPDLYCGQAIVFEKARRFLSFEKNDSMKREKWKAFFGLNQSVMEDRDLPNHALAFYGLSSRKGLKGLVQDIACVAPQLAIGIAHGIGKDVICGSALFVQAEQIPDPNNRITLGIDKDSFGVPRPSIYWRKTALDLDFLRRWLITFGAAFAESDLGRIKYLDWVFEDGAPVPVKHDSAHYHHMGGTRMSLSPDHGVVDPDLRVYGTRNLYVGGSSVFSTSGWANPTLPIVQLSLRLGDHIFDEYLKGKS